jgi:hypothetical protein
MVDVNVLDVAGARVFGALGHLLLVACEELLERQLPRNSDFLGNLSLTRAGRP